MNVLKTRILQFLLLGILVFCFCQNKITERKVEQQIDNFISPGSYDIPKYLHRLRGKKIALVIHPCSVIGEQFLLDSLLSLGIHVEKIFVPEHGFRGNEDAGETVFNTVDTKSGIPVISLYGKNKRPKEQDLEGIELIVFDLQDVGVRFYTYLSSLHYIMEACAEQNMELLILDRPNPNGFYVDGPVLEPDCKSFIGLHPIPIVHGMTLAELASMIKGEQWINKARELKLNIVPCRYYTHKSHYQLKIKPSPNLPNNLSILLYPSLCLLEGTIVSLGRGTDFPFQIYGHPDFIDCDTSFIPVSKPGAKNPPLLEKKCKGFSLLGINEDSLMKGKQINLFFIKNAYKQLEFRNDFFLKNNFIDQLIGNKDFKKQIQLNWTDSKIRGTWKTKLDSFKLLRKKYLLYKDFN